MRDPERIAKSLQALRHDERLAQLERALSRFNIWQALNLTRQEVRHSAFLRWLLDPRETHGLGGHWLRALMREIVDNAGSKPARYPPGGKEWSLTDTVVTAEWQCAQLGHDRIDILIQDDGDRLVCVIENKVDSGERDEQLQRYRRAVENHFGLGREDYRLAFLYLTKDRDRPSDLAWHPVSYGDLVEVIAGAMREAEVMGQEVRLFIKQYVDTVRRYIMRDSEVQQLCRELSKEHGRALREIFRHWSDRSEEVAQAIRSVMERWSHEHDLRLADSDDRYHRFMFKEMDCVPKVGTGTGSGNELMLWEIVNRREQVRVQLALYPGEKGIRDHLEGMAFEHEAAFGRPNKRRGSQWQQFRPPSKNEEIWIGEDEYEELDEEGIIHRVEENLQRLRNGRVTGIARILSQIHFHAEG